MERNPLSTPVRGDTYGDGSTGTYQLIAVDALLQEGVSIEVDGGKVGCVIPWDSWAAKSVHLVVIGHVKDPCPNYDASGSGHVGKRTHVKTLGRCYNRYRCLACGRTYDVDSSD